MKIFRHLLAHPVITSFLNLKWRRIRSYFYINLMLFFLYLICLTSYLLVWSEFNSNEALVSGLRYGKYHSKIEIYFFYIIYLLFWPENFYSHFGIYCYNHHPRNLSSYYICKNVLLQLWKYHGSNHARWDFFFPNLISHTKFLSQY